MIIFVSICLQKNFWINSLLYFIWYICIIPTYIIKIGVGHDAMMSYIILEHNMRQNVTQVLWMIVVNNKTLQIIFSKQGDY